MGSLSLIGVPSSMGAFAPGQEKAPAALREAGLVDLLREHGLAVDDHGDSTVRRWSADRDRPYAQNLASVTEAVRETAERVRRVTPPALVLGGDCTVGLGTVAGQPADGLGLLYFDMHADLNVPSSVTAGALDWMGVAHLLREDGAEHELSSALPLVAHGRVVLFSHLEDEATAHEREAIERLGLDRVPLEDVARDPEGRAAAALELIEARCERFVLHFDVDVVDFVDAPLSEARDRNIGLTFHSALRALRVLARSDKLSALTVSELNPDHGEEDGSTLRRFAEGLARALAG
ncbi:MAG: arginase family protein [Thermoleophilaceae bacterium]